MATPLLPILYKAAASPYGIAVSSSNPLELRQRFYAVRRDAKNPMLDSLVFTPSRVNPTTELWIVNNAPQERTPAGD